MIITLCGSTRFKPKFREMERELALRGHIVLTCSLFAHYDNIKLTDIEKARLDLLHLDKINLSNAILVINQGGYIGESTKKEIEYAQKKGKKIMYMEVI